VQQQGYEPPAAIAIGDWQGLHRQQVTGRHASACCGQLRWRLAWVLLSLRFLAGVLREDLEAGKLSAVKPECWQEGVWRDTRDVA
jgi:hypothetical protein